MTTTTIAGRGPNNSTVEVAVDADGKLYVLGSFDPPVGGATEAKQDDQIGLLGGGLPDALTAGGNLKVSIEESTGGGLTDAELRAADVKVTLDSEAVVLGAGTAAVGKLTAIPGLDVPAHDYIALSYTGSDLTGVVYKTGGSGGTTVATLTLGYTNSVLTSVTRT